MDNEIHLPGWNIKGWSLQAREEYYANWDETYSRLEFSVDIDRPVPSSMIKVLLPIIIIALAAFVAFWIHQEDLISRLTLGIMTLLVAVAHHLAITLSIPPTSYLMVVDKMMVSLYVFLVFSLIASIWVARHAYIRKDYKKAQHMDRKLAFINIILPFITYFILSFF
jgi:hypothetical protein